ncbi:unnamed protein product, partial [Arabidopsis halleri]
KKKKKSKTFSQKFQIHHFLSRSFDSSPFFAISVPKLIRISSSIQPKCKIFRSPTWLGRKSNKSNPAEVVLHLLAAVSLRPPSHRWRRLLPPLKRLLQLPILVIHGHVWNGEGFGVNGFGMTIFGKNLISEALCKIAPYPQDNFLTLFVILALVSTCCTIMLL